jgi:predicted DNA-binding protein
MTIALKRTSMALDTETIDALDSLSKKWAVSKAEVMRRAIKKIKQEETEKLSDAKQSLQWLKDSGTANKKQAQLDCEEAYQQRKS